MAFSIAEVAYDSCGPNTLTQEERKNSITFYRNHINSHAGILSKALSPDAPYSISHFAADLATTVKIQADILSEYFSSDSPLEVIFTGKSKLITKKLFNLSIEYLKETASIPVRYKGYDFSDSQNQRLYLDDDCLSPQGRGTISPVDYILNHLDSGANVVTLDDHCSNEAYKAHYISEILQGTQHPNLNNFVYLIQVAPEDITTMTDSKIPNVDFILRNSQTTQIMAAFSKFTSALVYTRMYKTPQITYGDMLIPTSKDEVSERLEWENLHLEFRRTLWPLVETNLMAY